MANQETIREQHRANARACRPPEFAEHPFRSGFLGPAIATYRPKSIALVPAETMPGDGECDDEEVSGPGPLPRPPGDNVMYLLHLFSGQRRAWDVQHCVEAA